MTAYDYCPSKRFEVDGTGQRIDEREQVASVPPPTATPAGQIEMSQQTTRPALRGDAQGHFRVHLVGNSGLLLRDS